MEKKKSKVQKLEPRVAQQLENQLKSLHGIKQAVVELREEPESIARLNLSDLFISPRSSTQYEEQNRTALNIPAQHKKKQLKPTTQSIYDGGELQRKEEIPKTLSQVLERAVKLAPEKGIVYVEDDGFESF
jgi:surfactin family lipopeptide synthetase A